MKTFSALLALCAGNSPATDDFPAQRPVTRIFDVFIDLRFDINGEENNREAGDLRRHRAHFDVIVIRNGLMNQVSLTLRCAFSVDNQVHAKNWFMNII